MRPAPPSGALFLRALLAATPIFALSFGVMLVNRVEPLIFGFPFLFCWIAAWALLTPAFLWVIGRVERRW
jgi:hypothetical protein